MRLSIISRLGVLTVCALLVLAVACGDDDDDDDQGAQSGPLSIVATTTQIADFARNVAGPDVQVVSLVQPNQDPHDAELQPDALRSLENATIVLRHGRDFDQYADQALDSLDESKIAVVTAGVPENPDDPHVWFSVQNAKIMVDNVREALERRDPSNANTYQRNADAYLRRLDQLESFVRSETDRVPRECRKLVTDHEVLTHYAAAYNFQIIDTVIPGSSTAAEPSARDITSAIETIRAAGVPAIFAQASENPAVMERIAREANVRIVTDLYADSLGPPGSDGDTYVKMMEANTRKIVGALERCTS